MHQWLTRSWSFLRELAAGVDTAHAVMLGLEPTTRPVGAPAAAPSPAATVPSTTPLVDVVVPDSPAALFVEATRPPHRRLPDAGRLASAEARRRRGPCRRPPLHS